MRENKLIFLIGMPAVGKTYWGKQLAAAYRMEFIDLDDFIAEKERASVSAIFASYGENGFREREHRSLQEIIHKTTVNTIIACGGGTPCFFDNMLIMKDAGIVIYLQSDISALISRLDKSEEVRPLLKGRGDMATYLDSMLQIRRPFYIQAHHILQFANISLATFAEIILL